MRPLPIAVLLLCGSASVAISEDVAKKLTVKALLAQDYAIVGTTSAHPGGVGLLLKKNQSLYFCYVSETPNSAAVHTEYCKPVE